jgi:hypothetical protein
MNKDVADKWVAALRSGKYEQTIETLQDKNGFCCLGVLCKVGEDNSVNVLKYTNGLLDGDSLDSQKDIINWSGMRSDLGELSFTIDDDFTELAELNDSSDYGFNKIADIIEVNWKEL